MMKYRIGELLVCILLFVTGLISPHNVVDERVRREPLEMLVETIAIVLIGVSAFIIGRKFLIVKNKLKKVVHQLIYRFSYSDK